MPQTQFSEQKGNPESIFDSSFPPKAAWPALNPFTAEIHPKWFDGSPALSPLTGKHNRQFQAMRKILRIPRNWRPQNRELERRVNSAVAGEFLKRKRERKRKEKRRKRAKMFEREVSWKVKGRRGRCPALSGRHCRDRQLYPCVGNAQSSQIWPESPTQERWYVAQRGHAGVGPAPLNPRLPEPAFKGG